MLKCKYDNVNIGGYGMVKGISIEMGTENEMKFIDDRILEHNLNKAPFAEEPAFDCINIVMKNYDGDIIAGAKSTIYCYNILFLSGVWVEEKYIHDGLGSKLLEQLESQAKEKGCYMAHVITNNSEAKEFYHENGYDIFGVIKEYPTTNREYFMKKKL